MKREACLEAALYVAAGLCFVAGSDFTSERSSFQVGPRAKGILRVVTWNVGNADQSPLSDGNLEHVAAVILELQPDLCFLQEVRSRRQLLKLRRELGPGWIAESALPEGGRRVAALAPRGALRSFRIEGPGAMALAVEYMLPGQASVVAVGQHADAFSSVTRNLQVGACVSALLAHGRHPRTILVGDLNLDLDLDKRRDLFTDDEYRDVETYNFAATRMTDAARGSGSTAEPDRRLDYIFVSEGFTSLQAGPVRGRRVGSMDHHPVACDLVAAP